MSNATLAACVMCDARTYVQPLHDDKGGPLTCPVCAGKWHAQQARLRKWRRIIMKAVNSYDRERESYSPFVLPEQRDTSSEFPPNFKDPLQPTYPCEACSNTVPAFYCDPCRAERKRREQKWQEEQNAKQREVYAHENRWRKLRMETCEGCGEQFKGKRKDAKYCSAACRQRAHRKRKSLQINNGGNSLPLNSCDAEAVGVRS